LPRLVFDFNQRSFARLYQMIGAINRMTGELCTTHPELK
jgi:hypothetical protein